MPNEDLNALKPDEAQSDPGSVVLYGSALVDRLTYISTTFSSLIMSVGKAARDDRDVLVPLVEVKFEGPTGQDEAVSKTFFSELVPLENVAFVLEDISSDFTTICRHLSGVSAGPVKPDFKRLGETKRLLNEAKDHIEKCLAELEGIG
ncbi:hypothetical protein SAMN05216337_101021 [Bradyrhizobium brasilense]|uniref:Uncharacterized protein n=1 Tax=Bradyrhizobium brasilense TaxID=1419277 RepID=A0A1G6TX60_9BRAD|nr:hypothetical protein [Bradyrhizobium brasilense]SDD32947.1 hypothetical protein SAMN05216337_101021 [Bradyrhizobium brasilense]